MYYIKKHKFTIIKLLILITLNTIERNIFFIFVIFNGK